MTRDRGTWARERRALLASQLATERRLAHLTAELHSLRDTLSAQGCLCEARSPISGGYAPRLVPAPPMVLLTPSPPSTRLRHLSPSSPNGPSFIPSGRALHPSLCGSPAAVGRVPSRSFNRRSPGPVRVALQPSVGRRPRPLMTGRPSRSPRPSPPAPHLPSRARSLTPPPRPWRAGVRKVRTTVPLGDATVEGLPPRRCPYGCGSDFPVDALARHLGTCAHHPLARPCEPDGSPPEPQPSSFSVTMDDTDVSRLASSLHALSFDDLLAWILEFQLRPRSTK